ncbi:MAG TPA: hypothetical protein VNS09_02535 [Solirubrobacter sp.]|nr:hypothetical protein [Solirubrobacter sp.]
MSTPAKLAAFATTLAVLFGGGALAGAAIDPNRGESDTEHGGADDDHDAPDPVRGLAVAEHDLRVVVENPELRRGQSERLRFRIVDERGETVRDFDVEHEKRMHLIVARRDLTGFQHLHPEQAADGTWAADVALPEAGSYRLFADFAAGGTSYTLASDLRVDGDADLQPLPAPASTAVSEGGYAVRMHAGDVRPGREADLRFTIAKDGHAVRTEPYLGAGGHLVALREGDMAFLHVHPTDDGAGIGFMATFPTAGRYRLFLQFKHAGRVQTVAFTQEVK